MRGLCLSVFLLLGLLVQAQQTVSTRILKTGLTNPWEILWGRDNALWTTEKGGRISKINPSNGNTEFSFTIPDVYVNNEGGLLGMVQHPDFTTNGYLYVVYNYDRGGVYTEKIVRWTYGNNTLANPFILMDNIPANTIHNGSRLVIVDGYLFVTTGDANNTGLPQDNGSPSGKVLRIRLDGSVPADNPIAGNPMWSKGHRNAQGLVYAHNKLYASEHGSWLEDEINIIERNRNYGWPNVEGPCDGGEVGFCNDNNIKPPLWSTGGFTIAVSGMDYYGHAHLPDWQNSLLLATLKDATLYQFRLSADGNTIVSRREYFRGNWGRLRDIAVSPDGKVYICTGNGGGNDRIIEVTNSNAPPPPPPNQSPVASAGNDITITLPVNTVNLNGSATDGDGTISRYAWTQVNGPAGATIVSPTNAATRVNGLTEGSYLFRLTVTDNLGATASDEMVVTVRPLAAPPANQPPVAQAGTDQTITLPANAVTLNGTGRDPDGNIVSWQWTKTDGPPAGQILSPAQAQTQVTGLQAGSYVFRLLVTDNGGLTAFDEVRITVNDFPSSQKEEARILKTGLNFPWEMLWGRDNMLWLTEREGRVSRINPADGQTLFSFTIGDVRAQGDGGLLGMIHDPAFLNNGYLYVVYNYDKAGVYTQKVVRLTYTGTTMANPLILVDDIPAGNAVNGSRLTISGDKLFITTGATIRPENAQDMNSLSGKVLRVYLDGRIPADNPVAGSPIWTLGHRNAQGMTWVGNRLFISEHGGSIEDEVNVLEAGRNYGWPLVEGPCDQAGETNSCSDLRVVAPFWSTGSFSTALCGMDYYNLDYFSDWKNSLLVTTLKDATLYQIKLTSNGQAVAYRREFFRGNWGRLRDIAISPDGKVYLCTSNGGGNDRIIELSNPLAPGPQNRPPTADAGQDQTITLPQSQITLRGTGRDQDGTISRYQWTKIAGPTAGQIIAPNSATTDVSNLAQGTYSFRLTVTDNDGASGADTVVVTVRSAQAANQTPRANAGPDRTLVLPLNRLLLQGSGSDPDGTILGYRWLKISGPAAGRIVRPDAAETEVTDLAEGLYHFVLEVRDNENALGRDTMQVRVAAPPNQAPLMKLADSIEVVLPVQNTMLDGGQSKDPDGQIVQWEWRLVRGPSQPRLVSPLAAQTLVTDLIEGIYVFELSVTDNQGAKSRGQTVVSVKANSGRRLVPYLSLFPNPSDAMTQIQIESPSQGRGTIRVYDLHGRVVRVREFVKTGFRHLEKMDLGDLPAGTYYVELDLDRQEKVIHKLIRK